jgi:hypothetical protein
MSYAPTPTGARPRPGDSAAASASTRGQARGDARGRGATNGSPARGNAASTKGSAPRAASRGRPFEEPRNWKQLGLLAGGIAAGAVIGAGVALLFTTKTGPQRRARIARTARHLGHDAEQRWEDLGFALKEAARSARDRFRHRHAADNETAVDD